MEQKPFNEQERLELITRMIQNSQKNLAGNVGTPFWVWGYTTVFTAITVYGAISHTGDYRWNFLWILIPLIGYTTAFISSKRVKEPKVITHIDKITYYLWTVLGLVALVTGVLSFCRLINEIMFIIPLLMGIGVTCSGLIIKLKPLVYCGIIGLAITMFMPFINYMVSSILVFGLIFFVMMVIPGHILNYRFHKEKHIQ